MSVSTISPKDLFELRQSGRSIDLIDVRTPVEYREIHVDGARLVPLDRLDAHKLIEERNGSGDNPLYVFCRTGNRARKACEKLLSAGHRDVFIVDGGVESWEKSGLPVKRGKKAISLERQVRIAAGSLVLVGVLLGFFVHWVFLGIAAFVGAGLVFAGVTDTCGMAMLLARMPWNQVREEISKEETPACSAGGDC